MEELLEITYRWSRTDLAALPVPALVTMSNSASKDVFASEQGAIMKVVITGAHGKVGRAATQALLDAGHDVLATDLTRPVFEREPEGTPRYQMADLTDAGEAFAVIRGADAVVHCATIPEPSGNPPQVVF